MELSLTKEWALRPFTPIYRERRRFARLPLPLNASLRRADQDLDAKVENLSIKGAFVTVAAKMAIDDVVAFTIYHPVIQQDLCNLIARVVRTTENGVGLQFERTLLD